MDECIKKYMDSSIYGGWKLAVFIQLNVEKRNQEIRAVQITN